MSTATANGSPPDGMLRTTACAQPVTTSALQLRTLTTLTVLPSRFATYKVRVVGSNAPNSGPDPTRMVAGWEPHPVVLAASQVRPLMTATEPLEPLIA